MRRMLTVAVGTMLSVSAAGAWAQVDASGADRMGNAGCGEQPGCEREHAVSPGDDVSAL